MFKLNQIIYSKKIKGLKNNRNSFLVHLFVSLIIAVLCVSFISCRAQRYKKVYLATTTSTYDSGLLEVLISAYEEQSLYEITPIAVGTGEALAMGERGVVDILLVHARLEEDKFISQGFGIRRDDVMHNDFVIIGPRYDPLKIKGLSVL